MQLVNLLLSLSSCRLLLCCVVLRRVGNSLTDSATAYCATAYCATTYCATTYCATTYCATTYCRISARTRCTRDKLSGLFPNNPSAFDSCAV